MSESPGQASSMLPSYPELTVVIPCYNERGNVSQLAAKLDKALTGLAWEAVFVDDHSPDETADAVRRLAREDRRIRVIQRIGRRGLASAVIEGALSSSADYVAVIDGDLQHDETRLPDLLARLRAGDADVVVASRYVEAARSDGLANVWRQRLSEGGIRMVQSLLHVRISDPMSGYFMLPRPLFVQMAPRLAGQGFKILLDLLLSSPVPLRVTEVQVNFFNRVEGESKLDILVLLQFLSLIIDKAFGGLLPIRFISFALVGIIGILVNVLVLLVAGSFGLDFEVSQIFGTIVAMLTNFQLNNQITYRDQRLKGAALPRGLVIFMVACGIGAIANIGVARMLHTTQGGWTAAGAFGAAIGVVWNYAVSATLVWRRR